ncbi:hypothetical protein ACFQHV_09165 [Promicromonospora thailandica]|uniref:MYXO-CTERM domain-containing protein n=1 Tax=Promicromonospora thailandica TaxID=765201 RepID=A0A9X2G602_9MICO|nr:hypothetical protein [Promicromonospora thailandica]MCP2266270.1 hypothetical protein [Promicromonospora thailandica]
MERFTRVGAALLLALGLAAGPAAAVPAAAHGGKIDIELGTDGAGGVSAAVTWVADGHPVEESAVVVVRGVSDDGEKVGPVTLVSASEGVGWYRSEPALLGEGHWTLTARMKEPGRASVEAQVDVVAPAAPPSAPSSASAGPRQDPPEPSVPGADPGADAAASSSGDGPPPSGGLPGWAGWALAALVAAGAAVVLLRRRTT